MIVGIVGSEEAKFTQLGKERAQAYIESILGKPDVTELVSGHCHLGGIDIWAALEGFVRRLRVTEFPPAQHNWTYGYKPRNLKIAQASDIVYCITVDVLPNDYTGMRFEECYHCAKRSVLNPPPHVKSGGCWTMYKAIDIGKQGKLIVVHNY